MSKLIYRFLVIAGNKSADIQHSMECYLPVWYHDFEKFGIKTNLIPMSGYKRAQEIKDQIIKDYEAILLNGREDKQNKGFELFCSDGYYTHYFSRLGYHMLGVDLCEESGEGDKRSNNLDHARLIQNLLDNAGMTDFRKGDVYDVKENFDLILNIGGLYHIGDPISLIKQNVRYLNEGGFLVLQSIVADIDDRNYFRSPAPGWSWGCRFSHSWLREELHQFQDIEVLDEREVDADYNRSLLDRKYSSFLLQKRAFP